MTKRICIFFLAVLLCCTCISASCMASEGSPVLDESGVKLLSPEEFSRGIPSCSKMTCHDVPNDPHYKLKYSYADAGPEFRNDDGSTSGNNAVWVEFTAYAQALIDSGYYVLTEAEEYDGDFLWFLECTGPAAATPNPDATIEISTSYGKVEVWFSESVEVSNLQANMRRFNIN